jgi:hypothetical protein
MTQPTIAEILHLAADKFLAKDYEEFDASNKKEKYSCFAISRATESLNLSDQDSLEEDIIVGLKEMGLIGGFSDFSEFYEGITFGNQRTITPETQGARYAWLKFAALIAEEQGV